MQRLVAPSDLYGLRGAGRSDGMHRAGQGKVSRLAHCHRDRGEMITRWDLPLLGEALKFVEPSWSSRAGSTQR